MKKLKVSWWKPNNNFGDWLTPSLLKMFGIESEWCEPWNAEFIGAGSYLDVFANRNELYKGIIWGTGIMDRKSHVDLSKATVLALRGQNTANHSIKCETLGDPGLLANMLVKEKVNKQYDIGFIPHWNDKETQVEDCHLIDITQPIEKVIKNVMMCEGIISTSLHGLILADSLGLPRMWKYTDANPGEGFKFYDYQSVFSIPLKMNTWQKMPKKEVDQIRKDLISSLKTIL